jgi:hypothetical protein
MDITAKNGEYNSVGNFTNGKRDPDVWGGRLDTAPGQVRETGTNTHRYSGYQSQGATGSPIDLGKQWPFGGANNPFGKKWESPIRCRLCLVIHWSYCQYGTIYQGAGEVSVRAEQIQESIGANRHRRVNGWGQSIWRGQSSPRGRSRPRLGI